MVNYIKLTSTSITGTGGLKLLHGAVTYSWKNLVTVDPGEGFFGNTEAQFSGWENPTFNLIFHIPTGNATLADGTTYMTWAKWNQLVRSQYTGSSSTQTTLSIAYGASDTLFADYSASASSSGVTAIPIQIRGFTVTFNPQESKNAYLFTINAQVQVTK
jgi:hypothetical protein